MTFDLNRTPLTIPSLITINFCLLDAWSSIISELEVFEAVDCMQYGGCSHVDTKMMQEASEVGMVSVERALGRNSIVSCGAVKTFAVRDGQIPSYRTPTGGPWRRAACRGARLL